MTLARVARELDFLPLVEILAGDDIPLKRGAIEQLIRLGTPEAIAVLMSRRSDPSMEMRFYVNTAINRLKKEFDEELNAARRQMQMDANNVTTRLNLAKIYLRYADSGLLDPDMVTSYEDEAMYHLIYALNSGSPTRETAQMLINRQIRRRDWNGAEKSVQKSGELRLISAVEAAEYQAEIFYSCKKFDQVAVVMRSIPAGSSLSPSLQTAVLWWGGEV